MEHSTTCIKFPATPYQAYYLKPYKKISNRVLTSIYEVRGEHLVQRLEYAWNSLIKRHESLRVSFFQDDGGIGQVINPIDKFKINHYTDKKELSCEETIAQYCSPIDIEQAPLLRVSLFYKDESHYWMLFEIHHAILDGVSSILLFRDLFAYLNRQPLAALNFSYSDYSKYMEEYLASARFQIQKKYWENKLLSKPIQFFLHTDILAPHNNNSIIKPEINFNIDEERSSHIGRYIAANKITRYVFFAGIFSLLLYNYSGCSDIVYSSIASLRLQEKFKEIVTAYANFIIYRININPTDKLNLFFMSVFKETFASMANMEYPFNAVSSKLVSQQPVDSLFFLYHNHVSGGAPVMASQDKQTSIKLLHAKSGGGSRNLRLEIVELEKNYVCQLSYNPDVFKYETIDKFSKSFKLLINLVIKSSNISISELLQAAKES